MCYRRLNDPTLRCVPLALYLRSRQACPEISLPPYAEAELLVCPFQTGNFHFVIMCCPRISIIIYFHFSRGLLLILTVPTVRVKEHVVYLDHSMFRLF